ncbi:hypothetical protein RHGRI_000697 [Rhododendron griersonianum]|uniref:Uncharacterized protein n=1 Tax=Rhododendron griersonianum TaxID=479676 RepID=A0AAV6LHM8_9ERIC|nr:hypothetical protein RHGRI_000697 [Rhododendron griersonianum]
MWLGCSSIAYGMAEELGPFHIKKDEKTLYLNPYAWKLEPRYVGSDDFSFSYITKHSYVSSEYDICSLVIYGHDEFKISGMISNESYKQLNLLCDSQTFIHPSGQFDKALDMASEEPGEIDPYSILTPLCTATSSSSSQQKKRWLVSAQEISSYLDKQAYELQSSPKQLMTKVSWKAQQFDLPTCTGKLL